MYKLPMSCELMHLYTYKEAVFFRFDWSDESIVFPFNSPQSFIVEDDVHSFFNCIIEF